jgi:hypothetical protein
VKREAEIQIAHDRVALRHGRRTLAAAPLPAVIDELSRSLVRRPSCGVLPRDVRVWWERGDTTAVAVEIPPHARTVRWLKEGSRADYGPSAKYDEYFIAFPYVELLLIFRGGSLTGYQQLYYRPAPLGTDEELFLPNLYNVAQGYEQRCWVCLVNLRDLSNLSWSDKIAAVVSHTFTAAFNRSSEVHEGNSYWSAAKKVDRRIESLQTWQEATRKNPRFPLEVAWTPAGTTLTAELTSMFDRVAQPLRVATATDLAGVVTRAGREERT